MKLTEIKDVMEMQMNALSSNLGMPRTLTPTIEHQVEGFATVISGIRRCGKGTVMAQVINKTIEPCIYLNFDTPKLNDFNLKDFELVEALAKKCDAKHLFFDEIQLVHGWESYVRSALDAGYRVMVTGSNATMLSQELGTRLTGRHITKELFPFSFGEYCRFRQTTPNAQALEKYLIVGGFPQFLKQADESILENLLSDILFRDIAVRYGIKDVQAMQSLLIYLVTNISNLVSANKLTSTLHVKTAKTILEYFSYITQTYLVSFVPRFSYSYKTQMLSPKKAYCIDNGLHTVSTISANSDDGRRLENMVFCELRRKNRQIYYYNEDNKECDFIVCEKNTPTFACQVCYNLDRDNETREIDGLLNAMKNLNIAQGQILTFNQSDTIIKDNLMIEVSPVWKYFGV